MSYILKALKQAQESRSIDGTPVTAASQRLRSMERPRQIPWRWIAAAALVLNGLVLLLLLALPRFGSQSRTSTAPPVNTAAPTTPVAPMAPEAPPAAVLPPRSVTPPPSAPRTVAQPPPPAVRAPAVVAPPPQPQPESDAGPELRDAMSKFKLEVLVWAADPRDRMVFLSGRKFVEGQSLDGKVVVERINEDDIVLGYQGQRVRVKRP